MEASSSARMEARLGLRLRNGHGQLFPRQNAREGAEKGAIGDDSQGKKELTRKEL